jgi:hypothetical protein
MSRVAITGLVLANVKDYGAVGDGVADDTAAIQAAIDDAILVGTGGIFFPSGTYGISVTGLTVATTTGFAIHGAGPTSIIQYLAADHASAASTLLLLSTVFDVEITDLVLDGNQTNITNPGTGSLLDLDACERVNCQRVTIKEPLNFGHTSIGGQDLTFENCEFSSSNTIEDGVRSALLWDSVTKGRIADCRFQHSAPDTASAAIKLNDTNKIIIEGNFIDRTTIGADNKLAIFTQVGGAFEDLIITDNDIVGSVSLRVTLRGRLTGNRITSANTGAAALFALELTSFVIGDNYIEQQASGHVIQAEDLIACWIRDNDLFQNFSSSSSVISATVGLTNVWIDNNNCHGTNSDGSACINLFFVTVDNLWISKNDCHDYPGNIVFDSGTFHTFTVINNSLGENDIRFELAAYTTKPVIYGNRGTAPLNIADVPNLPEDSVIIGGAGAGTAGATNQGTIYLGVVDPEGAVTGWVGDTFKRVNGGTSTTLYVKETGNGTNTGWVALGGVSTYAPPEQWTQQNVAASQTNVDLSALVSTSFNTIKMISAGSITGMATVLTGAITDVAANSLIVRVTKNGAPGTLFISHSSGTNPSGGTATQAAGIDVYVAGDLIGVELTTLGSFAPATLDLESWLKLTE